MKNWYETEAFVEWVREELYPEMSDAAWKSMVEKTAWSFRYSQCELTFSAWNAGFSEGMDWAKA
jgi:hypothetical protein